MSKEQAKTQDKTGTDTMHPLEVALCVMSTAEYYAARLQRVAVGLARLRKVCADKRTLQQIRRIEKLHGEITDTHNQQMIVMFDLFDTKIAEALQNGERIPSPAVAIKRGERHLRETARRHGYEMRPVGKGKRGEVARTH